MYDFGKKRFLFFAQEHTWYVRFILTVKSSSDKIK